MSKHSKQSFPSHEGQLYEMHSAALRHIETCDSNCISSPRLAMHMMLLGLYCRQLPMLCKQMLSLSSRDLVQKVTCDVCVLAGGARNLLDRT